MGLIINTNIQSLNAQRNLNKTLQPLQSAMQRLSSGMRINSAKDDAAGLAIAVRMSSQIKGLNQAIRNANDAVSLVQTAEGAIDEITNALQRVRELAVQSANASNTSLDRGATDKEVQQLLQEVTRIATQTQFNNQTLLDGTLGSKAFQIGANSGQTITVSMTQGLKSNQLGSIAKGSATVGAAAIVAADNVQMNGITVTDTVAGSGAGQTTDSAYAKAAAINASGISGVTASATTSVAANNAGGVTLDNALDTYALTINNTAVANYAGITAISASTLTDQINSYSVLTGVTATNNAGTISLSAADGRNIVVTAAYVNGGGAADTNAFNNGTTTTRGTLTLSSSDNITISDANNRLGFGASATVVRDNTKTLANANVTTAANATETLDRIDASLNGISNIRADLGAILNRFTSTMANLSNVLENVTAAHSRIMDADFAAETANITKAQILQQAGISILAQANSLPQSVLTLLRQ